MLRHQAIGKKFARVAICQLNQWAMSFQTNKDNIIKSLKMCKEQGVRFRSGPELEISGYGCEDHLYELDTIRHSWQVLAEIIQHEDNLTKNMLCEFGMACIFKDTLYNCRVWVLDGQILLVRPKVALAHGGCNRENRWFKGWNFGRRLFDYDLPAEFTSFFEDPQL